MEDDDFEEGGGVQAPSAPTMPQLPPTYGQADDMEASSLMQGLSKVRQQLAGGVITPETFQELHQKIAARLGPLLQAKQQAAAQAKQQQKQEALEEVATQNALQGANGAYHAKNFPQTVAKYGDQEFYQKEPGKFEPVPDKSPYHQQSQAAMDAFLESDKNYAASFHAGQGGAEGETGAGGDFGEDKPLRERHVYNGKVHDVYNYDDKGRLTSIRKDADNPENQPQSPQEVEASVKPQNGKPASAAQAQVLTALRSGVKVPPGVMAKAKADADYQQRGFSSAPPKVALSPEQIQSINARLPQKYQGPLLTPAQQAHNEHVDLARTHAQGQELAIQSRVALAQWDAENKKDAVTTKADATPKEKPLAAKDRLAIQQHNEKAVHDEYQAEVKHSIDPDTGKTKAGYSLPGHLATPEARDKEADRRTQRHLDMFDPARQKNTESAPPPVREAPTQTPEQAGLVTKAPSLPAGRQEMTPQQLEAAHVQPDPAFMHYRDENGGIHRVPIPGVLPAQERSKRFDAIMSEPGIKAFVAQGSATGRIGHGVVARQLAGMMSTYKNITDMPAHRRAEFEAVSAKAKALGLVR